MPRLGRITTATIALTLLLAPTLFASGGPGGYPAVTSETLVEGHTVFAMLVHDSETSSSGAMAQSRPAAPALDDDGGSSGTIGERLIRHTPGVLWFNDQFVTTPQYVIQDKSPSYGETRYTTSVLGEFGAAVATLVQRELPSGRTTMPCGGALLAVNAGDVDPTDIDSYDVTTSIWGYESSRMYTDPNDRTWIMDAYTHYWNTQIPSGPVVTLQQPVWVVNLLGSPVFYPDDGENCSPFDDPLEGVDRGEPIISPPALPGFPHVDPAKIDRPPAGHQSPSPAGHCYDGMSSSTGSCPTDTPRVYNAFLVLPFERLTVEGMPRDHTAGAWDSTQTNGCEVGTVFVCPADDEDAEGNSHGFAPAGASYADNPCPPYLSNVNPFDHGGLSQPCDGFHATRMVDLYYSPDQRPPEPAKRAFEGIETVGSSASFSPWAQG